MRNKLRCCVALLLLLAACEQVVLIETTFRVSGACSVCPKDRLVNHLKQQEGIQDIRYTPDNNTLVLRYEKDEYTRGEIQQIILSKGYTVDGELPLDAEMDKCCNPLKELEEIINTDDLDVLMELEEEVDEEMDRVMEELDQKTDSIDRANHLP